MWIPLVGSCELNIARSFAVAKQSVAVEDDGNESD